MSLHSLPPAAAGAPWEATEATEATLGSLSRPCR